LNGCDRWDAFFRYAHAVFQLGGLARLWKAADRLFNREGRALHRYVQDRICGTVFGGVF
jgi:hypothetical protein